MKAPGTKLWWSLPLLCGIVGAASGYFWMKSTMTDLTSHLPHVPQLLVDDLVWSFGTGEHAREMISREPDEEPLDKVHLIRTVRLAIVSEPGAERELVLTRARKLCSEGGGKRCELDDFVGLYARSRLVPPGNDIECARCKRKREPLPPP